MRPMSGPTTLSGQVLSATTWNALLLPARFEAEQRSGRDGVGLLIRRVIRAKLLILGVFALALYALPGPLSC